MRDFNNVWEEILRHNKKTIKTLTRKKPNQIIDITPDGDIIVTTEDGTDTVKKAWVEQAWNTLVENTIIVDDDLPAPARHRSSFIMALLSKLDGVQAKQAIRLKKDKR
ncbi:hypothetical protein CBW65_01315 [Tumebacillus avium]|uniref:Uncharacterized protein n=1 Tax=Tumebacillus avium TaxID=1903704 RepID=A0A1Y0IH89_9BACL|nr:hypothetical protein [Tumebacillus avium]ARU59841.1 hypothetical protein CBW65_01315 [Tumebacillus avium]